MTKQTKDSWDMKLRVWGVFLILKIVEIGAFLLVPVYSYRLAIPYLSMYKLGFPVVTNVFQQWMLGVTIDLVVASALFVAVVFVGLIVMVLWQVVLRFLFKDYFALNMKWAKNIAKGMD